MRMARDDIGPVLLPEKFDGNQSFDDWVSHFECISKINGWNDDEKALWLKVHMTGKAYVAYNRFSHETQDSFTLMRAALRDRFEPPCKKELYKIEWYNRTKRVEDWADFGDDVCALVDKAFPELCSEAKEELVLFRFLTQLKPLQISLAVRQRRPKSVREAVHATLEFESYAKVAHSADVCHEVPPTRAASNEQSIHQLQCLTEALQQLHSRLVALEVVSPTELHEPHTKSEHNKSEQVRQQQSHKQGRHKPRTHTVICRKCKQPGHFARGCAGLQISSHNHEQSPLAINTVTSFYLSGTISGFSVSFLVDTGAGVSLINGKVWDKFKQGDIKVEATKYHNIVGVDGHPINVRGSATVSVNISNRTYHQKFIIADNITAEGILGMDFMEANKCVLDISKRQLIVE